MLEILIPTLKGGLELAFLLAVLSAYLITTRRIALLRPLELGALVALAISPGLTYGVKSFLDPEVVEGALSLLAIAPTLVLILWIVATRRPRNVATNSSDNTRRTAWVLVFAASLVQMTLGGLHVALTSSKVFAQSTGLLSTDQAVRVLFVLAVLALAAVVGVTLRKVVAEVSPKWVALPAILTLLILLVQNATTAVQIMLVLGILPLTDWLFRIIVPLINNYAMFYYALLAAAGAFVLLAAWERRGKKQALDGLNPAQVRKIKAASKRMRALTATVGALLALVILVDGGSVIYANRPISLSPPIPVTRQGDVVTIPADSVSDGKLYRFSYEAANGTVVRFLVIHKGSGVFGMGLDACEFCGVAGYHQDDKNLICNRCGAAINAKTVGFPGGCNPVPLSYSTEGGSLIITVEALQAATRIFGQ
ncbi:MAG: DUF2318 domain-containing protein [Chloroflexota bacterium]|nr:MAG: DUF2318 domain-containing protein [Chloroflexota bacterium]